MPTFLVVLHRSGPDWDPSRPMEEQSGWDAHASFMDGLVDAGFLVLGGPLADDHRVVHVVAAESASRGQFYSDDELSELAERAGFRDVAVRSERGGQLLTARA